MYSNTTNRPKYLVSLILSCAVLFSLVVPSRFPGAAATKRSNGAEDARVSNPPAAWQQTDAAIQAQAREAYGKVGMYFEANRGQTDSRVDFLARGAGYTLFLTGTEAVFVLTKSRGRGDGETGGRGEQTRRPASTARTEVENQPVKKIALRMKMEGSNTPSVAGLEELPGKVNYFIGNNPTEWHTEIPTFARVQYSGVYPGIDIVYYGNQQQLEYDFVVQPGAKADAIAFHYEGAESLQLDGGGDLVIGAGGSQIHQHKPTVYQEVNGDRREVESGYVLKGGGRVGFAVGAYDTASPLIIDPVLAYSTYLGGSNGDQGNGIAVDGAGNAYVTGSTGSALFPTASPIQPANGGGFSDAFVTKINAAGSALVYSTYLGGSGDDEAFGIAVDAAGNAYVTGLTSSTNFPTASLIQAANAGGFDAFVTKINAAGSALVYSTYLGGSGTDDGFGIAVDSAGNAYVTGLTLSTNFPTASPIQAANAGGFDAFVTKINAAGSALVYSTYLGGSGTDEGFGIAVDSAGNAYVTGLTLSTNFPTASPIQPATGGGEDAFVTKINAAGSALVYSTYLGGSSSDLAFGIAVDAAGNAYVTGQSPFDQFSPREPDSTCDWRWRGRLRDQD